MKIVKFNCHSGLRFLQDRNRTKQIALTLIIYFVQTILFSSNNFAQNNYFSGSLVNDTKFVNQQLIDSSKSNSLEIVLNKKTPLLAGLMSFALPGAGQIYSENYLKAGIFAVVEVGAILLAVSYDNKGDDQTDQFEAYANTNWSPERYAKWTLHNATSINQNIDPDSYVILDNSGKVNWQELNRLEGDIGGYYSHRLAPLGDQQYYEMIGKYSQFNVGWQEFGDDVNKAYIWNVDPLVDQFHKYSVERGKANDFYTISKWAVIAVVSNHFISALDAAWSTSRYNKKLNLNISIKEENIGFLKDYVPQLNIQYKL